ncbi:ABC transporter permease [Cerasicoccus maritimus]|uniref:ABC transporter permease n=1 Tax=Cerasicoccus maritimus TaxID=490089 RepID=UPI002852A5B0|nr:ABC transporter permease [Cerasicoccus maritimus]
MLIRDIRAMYRQSVLGYAWILFPPLASSIIWIYLNNQKIININTGSVPYPIFVLSGNLLWAVFNGTLSGMLSSLLDARSMLSKINIPHESLLISSFGKAAVNSLVPLLLLIPILPFYLKSFSAQMLLFPLGVLLIMLMGSMFAILLIPIATLYTDTARGIQLVLRFAFFLTPVVYPPPQAGIAKFICDLNPLSPLLITTRSWLIGDGPTYVSIMMIATVAIVLLLAVAIVIYKISIPYLIERLSA